ENPRQDVEFLLAARDLLRVWAAAAEALLHEVLVDQRAAGPLPVRQLPALPAADIGLPSRVRRPEPRLRLLRRQVLHDGVRLPEHDAALRHDGPLGVGCDPVALALPPI